MREPADLLTPAPGRAVHRSIASVADEWDELADRVGAPPFLRPGWFAAWWTAFGRGTLELLAVRRGGRLAGVLPMARRAGILTSLSNWHTPAFGAVAEHGAVSLEVAGGADDLERRLDEGFAIEARSWKGGAGTAVALSPGTRRFYADVARWAAGRGELVVAFLRLDGRPLAFDLALEAGGFHYGLKTGYDPEFRSLAPGLVLRGEMIARAFERGLASYEFCGEAAPWKLEWTSTCRERLVVEAFAPGVAGGLERALQARGRPLAKRIVAAVRR